jgi:CheY-like chemotaxis protein
MTMTTSRAILLTEDNEDDVFLMKRALKEAGITNPLVVAEDGQQAIDYLSGTGRYSDRAKYPFPAVLFLDLKLPFKSGHEVLAWVRQQPEMDGLIVVVLTSSNEPSDLKKCYSLGANSYLVKPPTPEQLNDLARTFRWYWLEWNRYPSETVAGTGA